MRGDLSIDFVTAIILIASFYAVLYTLLPSSTISFKESPDPLAAASYYFSDALITTPGFPADWASIDGVDRLGLAYGSDVISYPNILDARKVGAIDGQLCASLKVKTDVALNFAIAVESSAKNYSCSAIVPKTARLIERVGYLKNNTNYVPVKVKTWTW